MHDGRDKRHMQLLLHAERRVCEEFASVRVAGAARRRGVVIVQRCVQRAGRDAHVGCQRGGGRVGAHDAAAYIVLAVPLDFARRGRVQHQAEGTRLLGHLGGDEVAPPKLIHEALSEKAEAQTKKA
jgi:hypothetical protein